jgi:branched-chain amino acid transport system permease protein
MNDFVVTLRKNRALLITLAVLFLLFLMAIRGMSTQEWVITLLRGLSVGAVTFLVAAGLSLIFGLLDVLNLAHGTLFMIGAYIGWTAYVRPDTFLDLLPPLLLLAAGFLLNDVWNLLLSRLRLPALAARIWPWVALLAALGLIIWGFSAWPIGKWDAGSPANSPATNALLLDQAIAAQQPRPTLTSVDRAGLLAVAGFFLAGALLAAGVAGFAARKRGASAGAAPLTWRNVALPLLILVAALAVYLFNEALTGYLVGLDTAWMFLIAIIVALASGAVLGTLMETTLIRPLYVRPIYQLMLTLGLGVAGIELVQAFWGRTEFTMPKPALFQGMGAGCPATSLADWLEFKCSTFMLMGGRVRVYNEAFVIAIGLIVLIAVWLLIQRSRLGMVIRAGVQDSEMVEALGINVRRVFTQVFALGVALAALGGLLSAPSTGLSPRMGETLLLAGLIALAIGGLTSFPGAAAGAVVVGLLQQFIIKYGQLGIQLPFLDKPFKPTPPLVPASTVLLMVIVLLVLPQGLFGRRE